MFRNQSANNLSADPLDRFERNPSSRAYGEMVQGGFFLRRNPLDDLASAHSNSDFAMPGETTAGHAIEETGSSHVKQRDVERQANLSDCVSRFTEVA